MSMNPEYLMKVIQGPVVSEKANRLTETKGQIALRVLPGATKKEIKAAVEMLFEVEVASVTTALIKGKTKRMGRNVGKRKDVKKAYVSLVDGQDLDLEATAAKTAE